MANFDIVARLEKDPAQGILAVVQQAQGAQALVDKVYLYNPDAVNALVDQLNAIIEEIVLLDDYNGLRNKPRLNTDNTQAITPTDEIIVGTVNLHKISKTGSYNDLLNKPALGNLAFEDLVSYNFLTQSLQEAIDLAETAIQSVKTINGISIVGTGNVDIDGLPDQTGKSGKYLKTDGTDASWEDSSAIIMRVWGPND